jgi:hypothetical protein
MSINKNVHPDRPKTTMKAICMAILPNEPLLCQNDTVRFFLRIFYSVIIHRYTEQKRTLASVDMAEKALKAFLAQKFVCSHGEQTSFVNDWFEAAEKAADGRKQSFRMAIAMYLALRNRR